MRKAKIHFYKDKKGLTRVRIVASNGKILARSSKGYFFSGLIRIYMRDLYRSPTRKNLFKDKRGEWRWEWTGPGSKFLLISSEGYKKRTDCVRGFKLTSTVEMPPKD